MRGAKFWRRSGELRHETRKLVLARATAKLERTLAAEIEKLPEDTEISLVDL